MHHSLEFTAKKLQFLCLFKYYTKWYASELLKGPACVFNIYPVIPKGIPQKA